MTLMIYSGIITINIYSKNIGKSAYSRVIPSILLYCADVSDSTIFLPLI